MGEKFTRERLTGCFLTDLNEQFLNPNEYSFEFVLLTVNGRGTIGYAGIYKSGKFKGWRIRSV